VLKEREREREKEWARRVRDRETATPEPILTPRNELDQSAAALDDTPRPPAARPSASILGHAAPVPSPTPLPTPPPFALSAPPNKSPQRQSSRLREGLRNMLAFSRGAGAALMNSTASADAGTSTDSVQLPEHAEHAETAHSDVDIDMDTDTDASLASPISRTSSIRSVESAGPVSLSRTSSVSVRLVGDSPADANTNAALLRDASLRKFRARVRGTRPALRPASGRGFLDERDGEMGVRVLRAPRGEESREGDSEDADTDGEDGVLRASLTRKPSGVYGGSSAVKAVGRLVAVKMTARRAPRTPAASANTAYAGSSSRREKEKERTRVLERQRRREEEERTRVRFVREVEVLKVGRHLCYFGYRRFFLDGFSLCGMAFCDLALLIGAFLALGSLGVSGQFLLLMRTNRLCVPGRSWLPIYPIYGSESEGHRRPVWGSCALPFLSWHFWFCALYRIGYANPLGGQRVSCTPEALYMPNGCAILDLMTFVRFPFLDLVGFLLYCIPPSLYLGSYSFASFAFLIPAVCLMLIRDILIAHLASKHNAAPCASLDRDAPYPRPALPSRRRSSWPGE
jgi:hypothetical protein